MISHRWQPLSSSIQGVDFDFHEVDSLNEQWLTAKKRAEDSNPNAYREFMDQLTRSWVIETGIIEGLYTLDRGVTETLVTEGIAADHIERSSTNIEPAKLVAILRSHQDTIDLVNEQIKDGRPLTKFFLQELHSSVTASQETVETIDQFGKLFQTQLIRGRFKTQPNNPSRPDGSIHEYCPPEQVDSQLEVLIQTYDESQVSNTNVHPMLVAAWMHLAFSQIHPFQDGNGRVGRALLTWHLVRSELLPVVITRKDRDLYINSLERGDKGDLRPLVSLFVQLEKKSLLEALSVDVLDPIESGLVDAVTRSILARIESRKRFEEMQLRAVNSLAIELRERAKTRLEELGRNLKDSFATAGAGTLEGPVMLEGGPEHGNEYYFKRQVREVATETSHWVNFQAERYFIKMSLIPKNSRNPQLVFVVSLHHVGRELTGAMAATAFAEIERYNENPDSPESGGTSDFEYTFRNCTLSPFTFTNSDTLTTAEKSFLAWMEESFSIALKEWGETLAPS